MRLQVGFQRGGLFGLRGGRVQISVQSAVSTTVSLGSEQARGRQGKTALLLFARPWRDVGSHSRLGPTS